MHINEKKNVTVVFEKKKHKPPYLIKIILKFKLPFGNIIAYYSESVMHASFDRVWKFKCHNKTSNGAMWKSEHQFPPPKKDSIDPIKSQVRCTILIKKIYTIPNVYHDTYEI